MSNPLSCRTDNYAKRSSRKMTGVQTFLNEKKREASILRRSQTSNGNTFPFLRHRDLVPSIPSFSSSLEPISEAFSAPPSSTSSDVASSTPPLAQVRHGGYGKTFHSE
jgi:hypothetical protein